MWWYRDQSKPSQPEAEEGPAPAPLMRALKEALKGRSARPGPLLAMSLLIDSRIELEDGTVVEGPSWFDAERCIEAALGASRPLRLYNEFSKDYGDGYSTRDDLSADHERRLGELKDALLADPGVKSIEAR